MSGGPELARYRTWVFDCDGVLLDSNRVKTEAFGVVASRYGGAAADALVAFHVEHGGMSRYRKFEYLLSDILQRAPEPGELEELSRAYGEQVFGRLLECAVADGLDDLRALAGDARWLVVSGGAQHELREVFARRGLDRLFDGGIFGSPDAKGDILAREIAAGRITMPAIFLGDSRLDHQAATQAGLDFVFVSGWSEFAGWRDYCAQHGLACVPDLARLAVAR